MYQFSADRSDTSERSFEMFELIAENESKKALRKNYGSKKESVIKGFNFRDSRLLDNTWMHRSNVYGMMMFFRVMALCHIRIPVEDGNNNRLKYEAESPEEVAFLIAA